MNSMIPGSVRAAFVVEGTRGDIQPYLALALRMRANGYVVKIFSNSDHVNMCNSFQVPVEGVLYDMSKAVTQTEIRNALMSGKALKIVKSLRELRMQNFPSDMKKLWVALESFGPTVLFTGGIAKSKGLVFSLDKTIPVLIIDLQIMVPLSDKAPLGLPNLPCGMNRVWFKILLSGASSIVAKTKKVMRENVGVELDGKFEIPIMNAIFMNIPTFPAPCCYGLSTTVIPVHPEWPKENFYPCGFFTIDKEQQAEMMTDKSRGSQFGSQTGAELKDFLATGPSPVYIGWGSMMCQSPEWMVSLALEALHHACTRGILLGGWAGLGKEHIPAHLEEFCKMNVLFVSSAPHEWLFPQCACIVHHGGSGTTAASLRSGRPSIITPVMGDQFDFAEGVRNLGCGIGLGQLSSVTGVILGNSINRCMEEKNIIKRAKETGEVLRGEDGCERFCQVFDEWLSNEFRSGKWLKKHEAMLLQCKESWEWQQKSYCTIT